MKFYNAEDGMAIIELITQGYSVEEATALVSPTIITLDVPQEVEDFCADLETE